ncbi:hypothetical protein Ae331Ps2_6359c [Pseudonocardia sp. Ae331_Ps2]|nr:hypothetical protein Ae331Ps2_6359c [Pseudonocardia sp. Ae331_Ps2]
MTITELPASTRLSMIRSRPSMSDKCRPVVGSSIT